MLPIQLAMAIVRRTATVPTPHKHSHSALTSINHLPRHLQLTVQLDSPEQHSFPLTSYLFATISQLFSILGGVHMPSIHPIQHLSHLEFCFLAITPVYSGLAKPTGIFRRIRLHSSTLHLVTQQYKLRRLIIFFFFVSSSDGITHLLFSQGLALLQPGQYQILYLLKWAFYRCSRAPNLAVCKYTRSLLSVRRRNSAPAKMSVNFSVTAKTMARSFILKEL